MNSGLIGPRDEQLLNLNELANIANRDGVDVATVERDYAMTHIIASLANQPISEGLEFKGGNVARLPVLPRYRDQQSSDGVPTYSLVETLAEELRSGARFCLSDTAACV